MQKPMYSIEKYAHGWLFVGSSGAGIPAAALSECMALFPRNAIVASGVAHHLMASGRRGVAICVGAPAEIAKWEKEIAEELASASPEEAWWRGTDVGTSSASIFAVFCGPQFKTQASEFGRGNVPMDASDLGRCVRLLQKFPEWTARLDEVSAAYPQTAWPRLVARWQEITSAPPEKQGSLLQELR